MNIAFIAAAAISAVVGLLGAGAGAPPQPSPSYLVPILVALLSGTGGSAAFNWYKHRQQGSAERDEIISRATKQVVEGAEALLTQYREDLAEARRAIAGLQAQLDAANERIAKLEEALAEARGDRDRLVKELTDATERRGRLLAEMDQLRDRLSGLEALVGRAHSDGD